MWKMLQVYCLELIYDILFQKSEKSNKIDIVYEQMPQNSKKYDIIARFSIAQPCSKLTQKFGFFDADDQLKVK